MKAFVINDDQIKKVALVFAGFVIAAFISGYYLGAKNLFFTGGVSREEENNNVAESIAKPEAVTTTVKKTAVGEVNKPVPEKINKPKISKKLEQKPQKKTTKSVVRKKEEKKIQKKTAKPVASKKEVKKVKKEKTKPVTKKKVEEKKTLSELPSNKKVEKKKDSNISDKVGRIENTQNKNQTVASIAKQDETVKKAVSSTQKGTPATASITQKVLEAEKQKTTVAGKRNYSIQAGMFASEVNANSFIEKLKIKQFDAYVSDFVSSSGATKYNVRVGKFEQREQARLVLKEFQKSFSSPAYVVITKQGDSN